MIKETKRKGGGGKATPSFMQAFGGLMDGVTAAKRGVKPPKEAKNLRFGPGAGGNGLRAEFIKQPKQKFDQPRGPATTGSTEEAVTAAGVGGAAMGNKKSKGPHFPTRLGKGEKPILRRDPIASSRTKPPSIPKGRYSVAQYLAEQKKKRGKK